MIKFSFSPESFKNHIIDFFITSLCFFPNNYLGLFLKEGDLIPNHVAYLCPLCLKNFIVLFEDESIITNSDFSLDHYPPKNAGGNTTILVCKTCNNRAGHKFEFTLKNHLELLSIKHKKISKEFNVKANIKNIGSFNSKIQKTENDEWILNLKPNENIQIRPLDQWIENSKTDNNWELNITIYNPENKHLNKAILKSAYLYCFSYWGYEFAFSKTGELIRKVLSDEVDYPIIVTPLKFDKETQTTFEKLPIGVCYISKPEDLKCFVVNIKLKDKISGYETIHPVFIPNPTEHGIEDLKYIGETVNKFNGDIAITSLNKILKETPIAYSQTWQDIITSK